ncbi:uncharacterized protein A4U43_C01F26320 [Asparagus officinalis]|uniref:Protein THYLAKOID RHODANESE-LIKE, chloroplastic n=1 Tax=Asparagus officinalis TaxID=4686 RepID=A0A5P1FU46_ASPOF|nr:rhodanese-like domain-containing protein 4, chloroplastic [Asparagus officinalis]ONK81193.1 uncharacterized protein A4U43_C01F26320 [Asparagus officinalis]
MEVLNAAGLTPISLHKPTSPTERRTEVRKLFPFKIPRGITSNLAAFSSVLSTNGLAKALTYEEALNQSIANPPEFAGSSDFDIGKILDGIVSFGTENPLVIGGGAAVLAIPLILSRVLQKPRNWGVESAKIAYSKLAEDVGAQLLDIRERREFKEVGSPDIRSLKKKAAAVTYRGDDKNGFLKKLALKFKDPADTTLFILDKFDGNSELVAELVTANGFKAAYAIKDGAEGPRGWLKSGLPWTAPKKSIALDFSEIKDAITGALGGDSSDSFPLTLGLAAATGLGLFAFTEIETVLQLLGSAAIIQFVSKKLLFAEERKATLQQVDEYLNTKIAPKDLVDEIKMIGKALLPAPISAKSLPAPAQEASESPASASPVMKADSVPETKPEIKEEAPAEPPPAINSIPKSEVSDESLPGVSRPLSPFPCYPDFKPPSSPSPAKP